MDGYRNNNDGDYADTATRYAYAWYDGAVQSAIWHDKSYGNDAVVGAGMAQGGTLSGFDNDTTTSMALNGFGQLVSATITDGQPRTVAYTLDELGQIIRRDETRPSNAPAVQTGSPHEVWYRFAGREMGYSGNNDGADTNNHDAIADRQERPPTAIGTFRGGTTNAIAYADFVNSYDAVTSHDPGSASGSYTVRGGDTLQSIAAGLWGDAGLWYKIAEVNGMSGHAALVEGQTLTLPAGVTRTSHNASTFKPYDPAEAIGDLSPTAPKPAKKPKCGAFGMILVAAIAIGLSAWLGPQMIAAFSSTMTTTAAGVGIGTLGALSGGAVTMTSIGAAGAIAAGAITGAAASMVSQGIGVAIGAQDKFSWKGVGLAAIGGGLFGSKGAFGGVKSGIVQAGLRGATSNAAIQGIGLATGLQSKFDFAGVAAAGAVHGIGAWSSARLPGAATATSAANTGNVIASSAAGAIAGAATRSALTGESFGDNLMRVMPDTIANSLILAGRAMLAQRGGNDDGGGVRRNLTKTAYLDQPEGVGSINDYNDPRTIYVTAPRTARTMAGLVGFGLDALGVDNDLWIHRWPLDTMGLKLTNPAPRQPSFIQRASTYVAASYLGWESGKRNAAVNIIDTLGSMARVASNYSSAGQANALIELVSGQPVHPGLPSASRQLVSDVNGAIGTVKFGADVVTRPGHYLSRIASAAEGKYRSAKQTLSSAAAGDPIAAYRIAEFGGEAYVNTGATLVGGGVGTVVRGGRIAVAAESVPLSPFTQRYLTESGGRWGGTATRTQNYGISQEFNSRGYSFPERPGGGLGPEEFISGGRGGQGTYVDITAIAPNGRTVRIQTVTTKADGVTPTANEAAAAARIRAAFPNDKLILVPKRKP